MAADSEFARRLEERTEYLSEIAQSLVKPSVMRGDLITLRLKRIPVLTRAYFILNECYKARFMNSGHNTEFTKVAALTVLSIMSVLPFRPQTLGNANTRGELRSNELYALTCISAIIGCSIGPDARLPQKFWTRLLAIFGTVQPDTLITLRPYLTDVNNGREATAYFTKLNEADEPIIQTMIAFCELLAAARSPMLAKKIEDL